MPHPRIQHSKKYFQSIIVIFLIILTITASFIAYTFVLGSVNNGGTSDETNTVPYTTANSVLDLQGSALFASFTFTSPIINQKIIFKDTSSVESAVITQWHWNFGDGTTSNEQNPKHVYTAIGFETISFTIVDSTGKTSTTTKIIYVESLRGFTAPFIPFQPSAEFSVSIANPSVSQQVDFIDQSSSWYGEISSWLWTFGDGATSTLQNPTHAYSTAGTKYVTLMVIDSNGVSSEVTKTITVEEVNQINAPSADFAISSIKPTVLQDITFTDSSLTGSGTINQWLWNFNDGTTSILQNPTHAYSTIGVKTITLTVTDSNGKSSSITKTITVEKAPSAEFKVSLVNPTILQEVVFNDTSIAGSGIINNWLWNFGDNTNSTQQNPTHTYSGIGLKTVTLEVTDSNGKTSTVTHELTVIDFTNQTQIWTGTAWSASDMRCTYGDSAISTVLEAGKIYLIEVSEMFWYNKSANLAADAMYYTTDASNNWDWNNYNLTPDGHSFLQIDGEDVNWGAFSNGITRHTYSIYYIGQGVPLNFQIVDWLDSDYNNNYCHLPITIYLVGTTVEPTAT